MEQRDQLLGLFEKLLMGAVHVLAGVGRAGGNLSGEHPVDGGPLLLEGQGPVHRPAVEGQEGVLHPLDLGQAQGKLVNLPELGQIARVGEGAHLNLAHPGPDEHVQQLQPVLQSHIVLFVLQAVPQRGVNEGDIFSLCHSRSLLSGAPSAGGRGLPPFLHVMIREKGAGRCVRPLP